MLAARFRPPIVATLGLVVPPAAMFALALFATDARPAPEVAATQPRLQLESDGTITLPRLADSMTIVPDRIADAGDWPHGMVIGRRDSLLSALFAPLARSLLAPAPALL